MDIQTQLASHHRHGTVMCSDHNALHPAAQSGAQVNGIERLQVRNDRFRFLKDRVIQRHYADVVEYGPAGFQRLTEAAERARVISVRRSLEEITRSRGDPVAESNQRAAVGEWPRRMRKPTELSK